MIELLDIPEPYMSELKSLADEYGLKTPLRISHFTSQTQYESQNFTHVEENLNYSAVGLMSVFGRHFQDIQTANAYAKQPEKIANRVYANRMGNGDEESGDGWRYRGRGLFQITGKYEYNIFGLSIKEDIVNNPDLLVTPHYAVKSALWYWVKGYMNDIADKGSEDNVVQEITKKINGGLNGITQRIELFNKNLLLLTPNA